MSIRATVPLALVFAVSAWSSGLTPTAVGSNAMGGADVASVEGIEALQVNPAALGLMNADVAMRPGESRQSFHLNVSSTILTRGLTDVAKLVNRHRNNLSQTNIDTLLAKDPSLFDALWDLNRRPIDVRPELQLSLACGNMAFSGWALGDAGMTLHHQALLPSVDVADTVSFGGQVGMSQTIIHNELWAGISAKVLLAETGHYTIRASLDGQSDSLDDKIKDQVHLRKLGWAGAADLGVLWLPALDWRIGSALRDVGLHVNGETVTPQWDVGVSWLPLSEQHEGAWKRRLALSAAAIDLLESQNGWKPLSKLALGAELTTTQLPWRMAALRLKGGFLGGYPTAGIGLDLLRIVHLDVSTWAREAGWYTGQLPDRIWSLRLGIGW